MRRTVALLIGAVLLSSTLGCAIIDKRMASWMGHDVNDLIASWGPPQQTLSDGRGGKILVYTTARQWTTPGYAYTTTHGQVNAHGKSYGNSYNATAYGSATSTTSYTPAQTHGYSAHRMFWVDKHSKVYRWSWKGL